MSARQDALIFPAGAVVHLGERCRHLLRAGALVGRGGRGGGRGGGREGPIVRPGRLVLVLLLLVRVWERVLGLMRLLVERVVLEVVRRLELLLLRRRRRRLLLLVMMMVRLRRGKLGMVLELRRLLLLLLLLLMVRRRLMLRMRRVRVLVRRRELVLWVLVLVRVHGGQGRSVARCCTSRHGQLRRHVWLAVAGVHGDAADDGFSRESPGMEGRMKDVAEQSKAVRARD